MKKQCLACKEHKTTDEFGRDKSRPDGMSAYCTDCKRAKNAEWRSKNRHKRAADSNERYHRIKDDPEYKRKRQEYREANKEAKAATDARNYQKNKETRSQYMREWRKANPEKVQRNYQRRRALEANATVDGYLPTNKELAAWYERACMVPGCHAEKTTLDHVIPLSAGGTHELANFSPLCKKHNSMKRAKTIDYRNGPIWVSRTIV